MGSATSISNGINDYQTLPSVYSHVVPLHPPAARIKEANVLNLPETRKSLLTPSSPTVKLHVFLTYRARLSEPVMSLMYQMNTKQLCRQWVIEWLTYYSQCLSDNILDAHLYDNQARLEVGVIVLDLLHLPRWVKKSWKSSLTFLLRSVRTSWATSFPESTVATILALSETIFFKDW